MQNSVFQREYGKSIDLNLSESTVDKGIVPEYSELLSDESKTTAEVIITNNNNNVNNNKNPPQFGDIEMTSVKISTEPVVFPQSTAPVRVIEKQIETRRADGKRHITPMFVPTSVEPVR